RRNRRPRSARDDHSLPGRVGPPARRRIVAVSRGVLVATSSPALAELGLVDPFLAPQVFRGTLEDELETTIDARTGGRPTRVGFLVVAPGPPDEQGVLAVPQLLDDERIREQREDLTF